MNALHNVITNMTIFSQLTILGKLPADANVITGSIIISYILDGNDVKFHKQKSRTEMGFTCSIIYYAGLICMSFFAPLIGTLEQLTHE